MFQISVKTNKGTRVAEQFCQQKECIIGKDEHCFIQLHGWRINKQHLKIEMREPGIFIEDLNTSSGTRVNGNAIKEYGPLSDEDLIEVHSYQILVKNHSRVESNKAPATSQHPPTPQESDTQHDVKQVDDSQHDQDHVRVWRGKIHQELLKQMDLRRINVNSMSDEELRTFTDQMINGIVADMEGFPDDLDRKELADQVLNEAVGLGPLESLLAMEDVSEIMVNAADEIFFEKAGQITKSDVTFTDDRSVLAAIERIVTPLGRRIDESSPAVDARLKDGSRVNAVIPPIALKGPCITIRKFMKERLTAKHLVNFDTLNNDMVNFLEMAVKHKQNIIISGGTGSGKTTLLNVLSNFIPVHERVITVEDAAELKLNQTNLISLEARPPNQEGKGEVPIRELVKNCLRMRPDRIVVGECRGGETLDMLQAMNTGHDGSLSTAHANSPRDCISRLEVMVMMAGVELPVIAIREQISSAVNLIVQQTRFACGTRKIVSICEVSGVEGNRIQLGEIFKFQQTGYTENGKIKGQFVATGIVPQFYESLSKRGISVNMEIFTPGKTMDFNS
ncbi:Flp pilus assembly complex ATPase component TadA [Shewanella submarina]|uniref:ATPase, T2SS/T4P/T4SS family n=1 Tax=Shewanella submarina TaxID=2016376 RepID=A0ABV7GB38_9GAMM|nr:ATPase, T2SS/T4P/T4SS family [Shewanella submarina]MCL1037381.1 Flp pilus assembly complex ATPase component TadA [Shewanella submarina]